MCIEKTIYSVKHRARQSLNSMTAETTTSLEPQRSFGSHLARPELTSTICDAKKQTFWIMAKSRVSSLYCVISHSCQPRNITKQKKRDTKKHTRPICRKYHDMGSCADGVEGVGDKITLLCPLTSGLAFILWVVDSVVVEGATCLVAPRPLGRICIQQGVPVFEHTRGFLHTGQHYKIILSLT